MSISEYSFSVDDFQNPKIYEDKKAVCALLVRLLLLEPGTIQSHPDAGVGLLSRYRYSVEGSAYELQRDFQTQIDKYLPQLQGIKVTVQERGHTCYIGAEFQNVLYGVSFDQDTTKIETNITSIDDL